ncbi:hypothetical protein OPT61_g6123 [Boeremia exigua]|uniref:Uncharacterized protein n=1 Tax=Boeremia exigua TaxID=749465 RepID=A0ACC2I7Y5_9PLEO|nr:hypothetical protein OPT61_g6123 [Boeremia exigua]
MQPILYTPDVAYSTLHTNLNRLITSRLPLGLPPNTSDSTLYATGLLHFAHIYLTFESLWSDLIRDHARPTSPSASTMDPTPSSPSTSPLLSYLLVNPYDSPSLFTSTLGAPTTPSPELAAFLSALRPRGLPRSARLKKDLEYLLGLHPTDLEVVLAKYPGDKVADFCTHIRKTVHEKPWTLVAYAWCFYMAVFSGGRWIRAGLLRAGDDFWPSAQKPDGVSLQERGLSFWHFAGLHDGEDIKAEFKLRLKEAELLFTVDQRVDVLEEAKNIFQRCAEVVYELDDMVGSTQVESVQSDSPITKASSATLAEAQIILERHVDSGYTLKTAKWLPALMRRPEITSSLVALGCLVCVALLPTWNFNLAQDW